MATTVTSKGQVTIPKPVRDRLGIKPGNAVEFALAADGRVVLVKVGGRRPSSRFEALADAPAKGSARTRSWRSPAASRRHDAGRYQRPAGPCHQ